MTALIIAITLTSAAGCDGAETAPRSVQNLLDAMDAQREQTVKRLMAKTKSDKKRGKEINEGADFIPIVYQWEDNGWEEDAGTVSFLPCGILQTGMVEGSLPNGQVELTVTGVVEHVDAQAIIVHMDFVKTFPRSTNVVRDLEGRRIRGDVSPAREFQSTKVLSIKGIDTSKYAVGDEFESDQVFERVQNKEGTVVLRPFDMAAFKEWRQDHRPTKIKAKRLPGKRTRD